MELGRCRRLVPLVVLAAVGVAVLGGPPLLAAGSGAWTPPRCPDGVAPPGASAGEGGAWYRLDPALDGSGTLASMRLAVGGSRAVTRTLVLAPESFASGPTGGRVIAGSDDGARSRLLAIDPVRACVTVIGQERGAVVRSAIASLDGRALYEHRVDRVTRTDLGVWRRPLAGWRASGPARRVLDPLTADERYGPVFTTDLRLAADGSLVVSSCGVRLCRVRVLDEAGNVTLSGPTGPALGVADGRLITWMPCAGLPCPVVAHETGGSKRVLADAAWSAALGGQRSGVLVVDDGHHLTAIGVAGGGRQQVGASGAALLGGGSLAAGGAASSPAEVVFAPAGRAVDPSRLTRLVPAVPGELP